MEDIESKETLRRFVGDLVDTDDFCILFDKDKFFSNEPSRYVLYLFDSHNTFLQNCILLVDQHEGMCDYIEYYLNNNISEIEKINVENGLTALFYLVYCKKYLDKIFRILVNAGVNLNARDHYGYNAVVSSVGENDEFTKLLILEGYDIFNTQNMFGRYTYSCLTQKIMQELDIDPVTKTVGALLHKNVKPAKK